MTTQNQGTDFPKSAVATCPGSAPVPGAGGSVSLSQSLRQSSFRRDAETDARDARAPQTASPRDRCEETSPPGSASVPGAGESVSLSQSSKALDVRDARAPHIEEAQYRKRRLPHFEQPWSIYAVTMSTRERRTLEPAARTIVLNALRYFHLSRYELFAVCVMADHVHFLFQPWPKAQDFDGKSGFWSLTELTHSVKSFTAHEINRLRNASGAVWEEEVFDRFIRSESDLHEKFRYICRNPWDSKIVSPDQDYEWVWTVEDEFRTGSAPVPGAGESVPLSQSLGQSSFRRDAETDARDARAPQAASPRDRCEETSHPGSAFVPGAGRSVSLSQSLQKGSS